jgi:hypothetical protein
LARQYKILNNSNYIFKVILFLINLIHNSVSFIACFLHIFSKHWCCLILLTSILYGLKFNISTIMHWQNVLTFMSTYTTASFFFFLCVAVAWERSMFHISPTYLMHNHKIIHYEINMTIQMIFEICWLAPLSVIYLHDKKLRN